MKTNEKQVRAALKIIAPEAESMLSDDYLENCRRGIGGWHNGLIGLFSWNRPENDWGYWNNIHLLLMEFLKENPNFTGEQMKILNEEEFNKLYKHSQLSNYAKEVAIQAWNAAIRSTQKPVKWEPKCGEWCVYGDGEVNGPIKSQDDYRLFGMEFDTEEEAEQALIDYRKMHLAYKWLREQGWDGDIFVDRSEFGGILIKFNNTNSFSSEFFRMIASGEVEI